VYFRQETSAVVVQRVNSLLMCCKKLLQRCFRAFLSVSEDSVANNEIVICFACHYTVERRDFFLFAKYRPIFVFFTGRFCRKLAVKQSSRIRLRCCCTVAWNINGLFCYPEHS